MKIIFVLCCTISGLSGCGVMQTQPWQKAALSQPAMQLNPDPIATMMDEHIYFSREATAGGRGFSGGGCGCN